MPTPLIYDGYLYVLGNAGVFDCYSLVTGEKKSIASAFRIKAPASAAPPWLPTAASTCPAKMATSSW